MKGKILVVYYHDIGYPLRKTVEDLLYCFDKYSGKYCYYVNAAFGIPHYLKNITFDLVIFQDALLSKRSLPKRFRNFMSRCIGLKSISGYKIGFAQDEHEYTDLLNQFINDFKIDSFYSLANSSEWKKIYKDVDFDKVKFYRYLTGYIDDGTLEQVSGLESENIERYIDIGYRAYKSPFYYGRTGLLKTYIHDVFKEKLKDKDFISDNSNRYEDTFLGLDWYRFLLRCKYVLGVEGGASVLDSDGNIRKKVNKYLKEHPEAKFEEVERECFDGMDGNIDYKALSPRNFEACITKTCQILIEGDYSGILKPWKHYIPLKSDFSNVDEVIAIVKNDDKRNDVVNQAYKDIVESNLFTYKVFVNDVLRNCEANGVEWGAMTDEEKRLYEKNKKEGGFDLEIYPYQELGDHFIAFNDAIEDL